MSKNSKWLLSTKQLSLLKHKKRTHHLFFSILIKYYEFYGCFPASYKDVAWKAKKIIAEQLDLKIKNSQKTFNARTIEHYRNEIRSYFESLGITRANETLIKDWICNEILSKEHPNNSQLNEKIVLFMQKEKIEPFSPEYLQRIINSAKHQYEQNIFNEVNKRLSFETKAYLDGLLIRENDVSRINIIKRWPRGLSLKTILFEAEKLKFLNLLSFPDVLDNIPNKRLQSYYRNICSKYPSAIKEMPDAHRYALLSSFALIRKQQISDNLVELLIRLTKKIISRAENKLQKELSTALEIKKGIKNKEVLFLLASTILQHPDDVIKEAIFPGNSVNDFIFYGKMGVLRNRPEEFELSMLCLHLLQVSMVYINTLMVQQILSESKELSKLTIEEKRAITPLLNEHINPYGIFPLDLETRLPINHPYYKEAA